MCFNVWFAWDSYNIFIKILFQNSIFLIKANVRKTTDYMFDSPLLILVLT